MTDREVNLIKILSDSVESALVHGIDKTHTDYWRVICETLDNERVSVEVTPLLRDKEL